MTDAEIADRFKNYGIYFYRGMDDREPTAFTDKEREQIIAALRRSPLSDEELLEQVAGMIPNGPLVGELRRSPDRIEMAQAFRKALRQPSSGQVLVPREPTREMILAGKEHEQGRNVVAIYRAMLSAAEAEGRKT